MRTGLRVNLVGTLCVAVMLSAAVPFEAPVADAAMRGDRDAVRLLLRQGADVNAAQGDGMTALHWAAERGDAETAEMLIYAGANVEAITRIGNYTPLHLASKAGSAPVVGLLLSAGANANAFTTNSGASPLHLAASSGNAEVVKLLLDRGGDPNAREGAWDQTPLVFAAALNRTEVIRVLLEGGADPSLHTRTLDQVQAAADRAATRRLNEVMESMQQGGQDVSPSQVQAAIRAGREARLAALRGEAEGGDDEQSQGQGGDPDEPPVSAGTTTNPGGLTALHHAARQGHVEAVRALLDGGADVNQVSLEDGTSPLLMALINGQFDVAMLLVEREADPNHAADINGVAPLWATVNSQWQPRTRFPQPQEQELQNYTYLDVMEALLRAGADPDHRIEGHPWYMVYTGCGNANCGLANTTGSTAFWRAAYATDVDAMRLLASWGADPNMPTSAPAARRAQGGGGGAGGPGGFNPDVDEDALDPSGLPAVPEGGPGVYALHAAAGVGYGEGFAGNAHRHMPNGWMPAVRYLLEEVGADVNARDFNGYTPLHHAAARGDDEMILYLMSMGADITAVSRRDQTVADMANGPVSRISPFPLTVKLLESLGSKNNHRCQTC